MAKIVLNDVTNLNALAVINNNFDKLEQELQNKVMYRDNPTGEPNTLESDVDANGNSLYNVQDLTIAGSFTVAGQDVGSYIGQAQEAAEEAAQSATAAANAAAASQASAVTADASADAALVSQTAAAASASSASSSASSASSSATTATNAATSATASATTATTQAGIATTQASNAATSASDAATSATNANTAKVAAEAARDAALAAYDSFDDRYLGTKTSDPTLDNDGNALVAGSLYFSSTEGIMKLYNGTVWVAAYVPGVASSIGFTPTGNVAATNVQAAIAEVDSEKIATTAIGVTVQPYNAATARTNLTQTFNAAQRGAVAALTFGTTITPDFSGSNNFSFTMTGNATLANPINQTAGQSGVIVITQDATGSRTLAYGSNWKFPSGAAPSLTTTANAVDVLAYYVESPTRITARLIGDVK